MVLRKIARGKQGWKIRRLEILIMGFMKRATKPHCGWSMRQKLKRKTPCSGDHVCRVMLGLAERGYLEKVGVDPDTGWIYALPSPKAKEE